MVKCKKVMKDLVADFKTIFKKDKNLIWWMVVNFLTSAYLFLIPFFSVNPNKKVDVVRYTDVGSGYNEGSWYYLFSFSIVAFAMGIGNILLSARLYTKRGKDIARLFLGISVAMLIVAICFLRSIIGEG